MKAVKVALILFWIREFVALGYELYNERETVCCDGKTHPRPDRRKNFGYDCCGEQIIYRDPNNRNKICCGETFYDRQEDTTCCGIRLINHTKFACFNDSLAVEIVGQKTAVCGGPNDQNVQLYNPKEEICCGNKIYSLSRNKLCCGNEYMDTSSRKCCKGKEDRSIPLQGHDHLTTDCCNYQLYDITTQYCLKDAIVRTDQVKLRCCGRKYTLIGATRYWKSDEAEKDSVEDVEACKNVFIFVEHGINNYEICINNQRFFKNENESLCFPSWIDFTDPVFTMFPYDHKVQSCCDGTLVRLTQAEQESRRKTCCVKETFKDTK